MNPSGEVVVGELADLVGGHLVGNPATVVTGVTLDSQKVRPRDLFAALPGHKSHGAQYVEQAIRAGASAVLTDSRGCDMCKSVMNEQIPVITMNNPREAVGVICAKIYGQPKIPIIGITGTNGKTTTAFMVFEGAKAAGKKVGMVGTLATYIGDEMAPSARTTPEAPDMYQLLWAMQAAQVEVIVMEVSSIAIAEHRITGLTFDVVGFSNLSHDHLDYHGTMERYFDAKASIFTPDCAVKAVVNTTDSWGKQLLVQSTIPTQSLVLCHAEQGLPTGCDWCGQYEADGTLNVHGPDRKNFTIHVASPGVVNAENALLAIALLDNVNIRSDVALQGVATTSVPGRGELVGRTNGVSVYVDYAHSPDAITSFLSGLAPRISGSIITVVGAGGDRDQSKRATMGQAAAEFSSRVIVTDDNPRSEDPAIIREAIADGARAQGQAVVEIVPSRRDAIAHAIELASHGDAVAILGKGHENSIEVNGVFEKFNDAEVARELMSHV